MESDFGLCGSCWRDTPFITGLVCDACGVPLPGPGDGTPVHCDDCLDHPRPWRAGRAALVYDGQGRKMALALKHGARTELVRPAVQWMVQAGRPLFQPTMIVAPVPLHWARLAHRTFNQSALLAQRLARQVGLDYCPDLLVRRRRTRSLDRKSREERIQELDGTIAVHMGRANRLAGRPVLLIDDVMTSGATFSAATDACHAAGSGDVFVLALARVVKSP